MATVRARHDYFACVVRVVKMAYQPRETNALSALSMTIKEAAPADKSDHKKD